MILGILLNPHVHQSLPDLTMLQQPKTRTRRMRTEAIFWSRFWCGVVFWFFTPESCGIGWNSICPNLQNDKHLVSISNIYVGVSVGYSKYHRSYSMTPALQYKDCISIDCKTIITTLVVSEILQMICYYFYQPITWIISDAWSWEWPEGRRAWSPSPGSWQWGCSPCTIKRCEGRVPGQDAVVWMSRLRAPHSTEWNLAWCMRGPFWGRWGRLWEQFQSRLSQSWNWEESGKGSSYNAISVLECFGALLYQWCSIQLHQGLSASD